MSTSALIHASIEQAINQYLALDPTALKKLLPLHGKVVAVEITGLGQTLFLIPSPDQIQVLSLHEGEPDCTISGAPFALAQMSRSKKSTDQLFSGDVSISGDTELAHQFGKILADMQIDWVARLTPYMGSLIAEDVVRAVRTGGQWGGEVLQGIGEDLRFFLHKEQALLPEHQEHEEFLEAVDHVRDGVERLEARIILLEQTAKKEGAQ